MKTFRVRYFQIVTADTLTLQNFILFSRVEHLCKAP